MAKKVKTQLTEKEKAELREAAKKQAMEEFGINEKEAQLFEEAVKEAKMPIALEDKDFVLDERELDIRNLSSKNKEQMMFRMQILNVVYQRQITQSLVDIQRLMMLILTKMGCDDVVKELDEMLDKIRIQNEKSRN